MQAPGDSPSQQTFPSIFEHYSGFDINTHSPNSTKGAGATHLRRDSEFSTRSTNTPSSSNHNHASTSRGPASHEVLDQGTNSPLISASSRSSSSSLRHTVAMLKSGVFPPGLQQRRTRLDSDSDASHYDDEDHGFGVEGGGPFESLSASQTPLDGYQEGAEVFTNAPDSPFVPRRVSSVSSSGPGHAKSPAQAESMVEGMSMSRDGTTSRDETTGKERPSNGTTVPLVGLGVEELSSTPKSGGGLLDLVKGGALDRRPSDSESSALLPQKEKDVEEKLGTSAEIDDPNRPKTLKEARALAKERARLRLQAKEASETPLSLVASTSPSKAPERPKGRSEHQMDAQRQSFQSDRSVSEYSATSGDLREARDKDAIPASDSIEWRGHSRQRAVPLTPQEEKGMLVALDSSPTEKTSSKQALSSKASSRAMDELTMAVGEAIEDVSFASNTSTGTAVAATGDGIATESRLEPPMRGDGDNDSSAPSATSFDSARESPAHSSAVSSGMPAWVAPDASHLSNQLPAGSEQALGSVLSTGAAYMGSSSPMLDSSPSSTFVPRALHAQQRSTAPNKIARLDVYGKNVPWPAAFNPAAIIEQRRLAPWERARSYAHYCNDLTGTPSGLMVWMEMVQRPAQRIASEPAPPVKRHMRGEGTDHSTYATSVRSDASFPMRGDGGRAKELQQSIPATISESPPSTMPSNIPYPMLVSQPTRTLSSQEDMANTDRPSGLGRSGNFFTSLGRKGSSRRTPGSGSMAGLSSLSASSSGNQLRAMRGKGRTATISNPIALTSPPNISGSEPASSPVEMFSSPSPQTSVTKMQPPSSPLQSVAHARAPLGPRAPASSGYSSQRDSGAAQDRERPSNSPYGLSTTGGIYNVPAATNSSIAVVPTSPTDYSAEDSRPAGSLLTSPSLHSVKSSFSYGTVRDKSPRSNFAALHPPPVPNRNSSDSGGKKQPTSRRGSHQSTTATPAENEALDKLSDVLPDAERSTLLDYLRRANGNDLVAIGDYLQAQSKSEGKQYLR